MQDCHNQCFDIAPAMSGNSSAMSENSSDLQNRKVAQNHTIVFINHDNHSPNLVEVRVAAKDC